MRRIRGEQHLQDVMTHDRSSQGNLLKRRGGMHVYGHIRSTLMNKVTVAEVKKVRVPGRAYSATKAMCQTHN